MRNDSMKKIDALIESWQGEMIDMLRKWICIPSVAGAASAAASPFGDTVRAMLDRALADAAQMGFETDDVDGYCGAAQMGKDGKKTMGIVCHLDVVPAGDGWTYPPFALTVANGKMVGRGIMDDKGAAVAILFAMKAVREAGIKLHDNVRLIFGCDEEVGMQDVRYYAKNRTLPDYGFTPDADFPVINCEKGMLTARLSLKTNGEDNALIPVYKMNAGIVQNVVPGKAYAIVGTKNVGFDEIRDRCSKLCEHCSVTQIDDERAKIETIGQSAHASTPELGENAAGMLLQLLSSLGAGGGSRDAISLLAEKIGLLGDGSGLGIAMRDQESGALTSNLGILRYDGDELFVILDNRVPACGTKDFLMAQIEKAVAPARISVTCLGHKETHHVPEDSAIVQNLLAAYHEVTDLPAYAYVIGGGTYSRMFPNMVAFGYNFPGDPDVCHMPDECVSIAKYVLSTKVFAHAIARLAGDCE